MLLLNLRVSTVIVLTIVEGNLRIVLKFVVLLGDFDPVRQAPDQFVRGLIVLAPLVAKRLPFFGSDVDQFLVSNVVLLADLVPTVGRCPVNFVEVDR